MCFVNLLASSGLGMLLVFAVLAILMVAVLLLSAIVKSRKKLATTPAVQAPAPQVEQRKAMPAPKRTDAPRAEGSCGGIVLGGVEPKTAAMLMAIVADQMKKPLCELRFVSIKQIDD